MHVRGIRLVRAALAFAIAVGVIVAAGPPASAVPPTITSFTAEVTDLNKVTVRWSVAGANSANLVYLANETEGQPGLADPGFKAANCHWGPPAGCEHSYRVTLASTQRLTLSVANDGGERVSRTIERPVDGVEPPTITNPRQTTPPFSTSDVDVHWTHAPAPAGSDGWVETVEGFSSSRLETESTTPVLAGVTPVTPPREGQPTTRSFRYCQEQPGTDADIDVEPPVGPDPKPALCSRPAGYAAVRQHVGFLDQSNKPMDSRRIFLSSPSTIDLRFEAGPEWGDLWLVWAPTLGIAPQWAPNDDHQIITETDPDTDETETYLRFTIPSSAVSPGFHEITVVACNTATSPVRCTNNVPVTAPASGTVTFAANAVNDSVVSNKDVIGTVGSTPITATDLGMFRRSVTNGATVAAGSQIGYIFQPDRSGRIDVVVGAPGSSTDASISSSFVPEVTDLHRDPAVGHPLDVTASDATTLTGDGRTTWAVGEFGRSMARITDAGSSWDVDVFDAPLARTLVGTRFVRTSPFEQRILGSPGPASFSTLAEKVLETDDAVWFTQGGALLGRQALNHSRLVRFTKAPDPGDRTTTEDPRMCAIHVPGTQNEVVGLAFDGTRMWFAEWRPDASTGRIGWFVDDGSLGCDNDLDYTPDAQGGTPDVDAASDANECDGPSDTGCIHFVDLPSGVHPTHLQFSAETGGSSGDVWFSDTTGSVGRIDVASKAVQRFPLPPAARTPALTPFTTFPWQLRVTSSAVYVGEYGDSQIVRLDVPMVNANPVTCQPVSGPNPCMQELSVGLKNPESALHSIAISGNTLWYTVSNEISAARQPNGSYVGCIDLSSWTPSGGPTGKVYTDTSSVAPDATQLDRAYRGIEVAPNGDVVVADMGYNQVVRFTRTTSTGWSTSGWTACPG